jgi:hypothetical protein
MLTVYLEGAAESECALGIAPYFRIEDDVLLAGPDDRQAATYRRGLWRAQGTCGMGLAFRGLTRVRFHGPGGTPLKEQAPCGSVRVLGGSIWSGGSSDRLLARYDYHARCWYLLPDRGEDCQQVVFEPAP